MSNIAMSIRSQRRDRSRTSPDDGLGESLRGGAPSAIAERIPERSSPNVNNKSHIITAVVDQAGDGVLVAAGGVVGAYALFVKDGTPAYEYNWFGPERYRVTSSEVLPAGKSAIRVEFKYDDGSTAKGGAVKMFVNDKQAATGRVDETIFVHFFAPTRLSTPGSTPAHQSVSNTRRRSSLSGR
jgi:hypothetical protein